MPARSTRPVPRCSLPAMRSSVARTCSVRIGSSSRSLSESNTLGIVSEHESWPGEGPEPANGEVDLDEAIDAEADDEDTGDGEPELRLAGHDAGELDIPD